MPYPPSMRCIGRMYPRAPRGHNAGFSEGNWPLVWKVESGPTAGGDWSEFDGRLYWQDDVGFDVDPRPMWSWAPLGPFGAHLALTIQRENPQQTLWHYGLIVSFPGVGGGAYHLRNQPWGQPATIELAYEAGAMPGWTNKTLPFVLRGCLYSELPADFCL